MAARKWAFLLGMTLTFLTCANRAQAFALLGPYADWMDVTNSYRAGWDIGGPVDIGQEYRWNVPVVTYGFDPSFIEYFGTNGVDAVEQAIQILNDLPVASSIALTNFPASSLRVNYTAAYENECDLKSMVLALLVEQMGLTQPTRSVSVLRLWDSAFLSWPAQWQWPSVLVTNLIWERNFDPEDLEPSDLVNSNLYTWEVLSWGPLSPNPALAYAGQFTVDPDAMYDSAVGDWLTFNSPALDAKGCPYFKEVLQQGFYLTGLSQDDAGGLRYILATNNVNVETLLPGVQSTDTNAEALVDVAPRPGLDKITFVRQGYDNSLGQFIPMTNCFTDTYLTNGIPAQQQVQRVMTAPDFLFCAADIAASKPSVPYLRTGTSNWWNSSAAAGGTLQGPGVIRPPVRITFHQLGLSAETTDDGYLLCRDFLWGSYDASTNLPIAYPCATFLQTNNQLNVHLWLRDSNNNPEGAFTWRLPLPIGGSALLQMSTNLTDWTSVATAINHGGVVTWNHWRSQSRRFFRVVPQ
jgi:hypothetical protein